MGKFGDFVRSLRRTEQVDYVLTPPLPEHPNTKADAPPLEADRSYVGMFIDSIRIPYSRLATSKLHGVVHSFTRLHRQGASPVELAFVSARDRLGSIDSKHLNRVLTVSLRMLGPVPYRGGDLELETGLFSVKSADLVIPFLDVMTEISKEAGVGFIDRAAPFVPVIRHGVEKLLKAQGTAALEIGLQTTITNPRVGSFAVVAQDKRGFSLENLAIDPSDRKLLRNGRPVDDTAYMVLRIESSSKRPDFGTIPNLKSLYDACMGHVAANKRQDAQNALMAFRLAALASPDLIAEDARRLVKLVEDVLKEAFSDTFQNRVADTVRMPQMGDLPL